MGNTLVRLSCAFLSSALLLGGIVMSASAQRIVFGGGLNGGSVPRAMAPLCASARRLNGGGLSASAALVANKIRLNANLDYLASVLGVSVAECLPGTGISVDSAFAPADRSAFTLSGAAWLPVAKQIDLGLESGWVLKHSSWFIGPAIGGQHRHLRAEIVGRFHINSFEEVTHDFTSSPSRVILRTDRTERSWGVAARLLLLTRRR